VRLASWFGPFRHFVLAARIKCVTPQRVEYFDEAGQECFVDLDECARNWRLRNEDEDDFDLLTSEDSAATSSSRYVGDRALSFDPPWIEFRNNRRTRLEFESSNEALGLKLQLMSVRWLTLDAT
jgi:hypothetical protein